MVPMRHSSERVPGKNYRPLGGIPLYHHIVRTLLSVPAITQVAIDTDSALILEDAAAAFPQVTLLLRPEHLRDGATPMNDVITNTLDQVEADVVLQTHSTNPFLAASTIEEGLRRYLEQENGCDSVFGVTRLQARLWSSDGAPINHDPSVLMRTQDLTPIYLENSTMYIFSPEVFRRKNNRIGDRPLMMEVPAREAVDIDEEWEFSLAEAMVSSGH
jgi:CMP-N-acetylneuraminic acid synthetase